MCKTSCLCLLSNAFYLATEPSCGWFGVVVTALVTWAGLCYVEPSDYYWDRWWPLAGLLSQY